MPRRESLATDDLVTPITATSNCRHGVTQMLAALDLTTGRIHYRSRRGKRHRAFLDLLKHSGASRPRAPCT